MTGMGDSTCVLRKVAHIGAYVVVSTMLPIDATTTGANSVAFLVDFRPFGRSAICSCGNVRPARSLSRASMAIEDVLPLVISFRMHVMIDIYCDHHFWACNVVPGET